MTCWRLVKQLTRTSAVNNEQKLQKIHLKKVTGTSGQKRRCFYLRHTPLAIWQTLT